MNALRFLIATVLTGTLAVTGELPPNPVSFNRDVLPILQHKCQECHRPGEVAPMSFLTYRDARPWAKAIKQAVLTHKMPPWPADLAYGHFANDRALQPSEIKTLAAWSDSGAIEGEAKDKPAPIEWPDGWTIRPEVVVSIPHPFSVPPSGVVELVQTTIPNPFHNDTRVTSIEIRPGNRSVVHHADLFIVKHSRNVIYGAPHMVAKQRDADGVQVERIGRSRVLPTLKGLDAIYVPGAQPVDFRPYGAAMLIPADCDLMIEVHYTPNGARTADQTRVGFTLAKTPPRRQVLTVMPTALRDEDHFRIPAGDPNWECRTEVEFQHDAELIWLLPHMHLRGKDMTYRLIDPDGKSRIVLRVNYDFNWQFAYQLATPIHVAKGTRLQATAHFDNSPNNGFNPDPAKDVRWGDQTWEEMMIAYFGVIVDRGVTMPKLVRYSPEFAALQRQ